MPPARRRPFTVWLGLALAGCGAEAPAEDGRESSAAEPLPAFPDEAPAPDSAGEVDADALPSLILVEERRIGSLDDPDFGFSRIGIVEVGPDGRLYVFESQDKQIRVYTAEGELAGRIGRAGQGPGEFQGIDVRFGVQRDTVWASDPAQRRLTFFDLDGRVLSTARYADVPLVLHSPAQRTWVVPTARGADGLFVGDRGGGLGVRPALGSAPVAPTVHVPLVRFDPQGRVVDTVGAYPLPFRSTTTSLIDVGRSRYGIPSPPREDPLLIRETEALLSVTRPVASASDPATFRVTRTTFRGDTLQDRTFRYRPVSYPARLLDSIAGYAARGEGRFSGWTEDGSVSIERFRVDSAAAHRTIRAQLAFPEFQPPVQAAWRGNDGSLWLRRESTGDATFRWILLDPDLRPLGTLDLPAGFRAVWSQADRLWAVELDEYGVPWLVHYRIRQGG